MAWRSIATSEMASRLQLVESSVRIERTGDGRSAKVNVSGIHRTIGCLFVGLGLWCPLYARNPKMMKVGWSYNGREVTLAIGEVLEISMAEKPGWRWKLTVEPEPACSLIKSWFDGPATVPPLRGEGGTRRWQFQAVRPGTGEIKLEYRHSWEPEKPEPEKPPGKTFKLSVSVR